MVTPNQKHDRAELFGNPSDELVRALAPFEAQKIFRY